MVGQVEMGGAMSAAPGRTANAPGLVTRVGRIARAGRGGEGESCGKPENRGLVGVQQRHMHIGRLRVVSWYSSRSPRAVSVGALGRWVGVRRRRRRQVVCSVDSSQGLGRRARAEWGSVVVVTTGRRAGMWEEGEDDEGVVCVQPRLLFGRFEWANEFEEERDGTCTGRLSRLGLLSILAGMLATLLRVSWVACAVGVEGGSRADVASGRFEICDKIGWAGMCDGSRGQVSDWAVGRPWLVAEQGLPVPRLLDRCALYL